MRAWLPLLLVGAALSAACIDHPDGPTLPPNPSGSIGGTAPETPTTTTSTKDPQKPPTPTASKTIDILQEAVYVLMTEDRTGEEFMCTGTLVSKDRVITAGHCLPPGRFRNYQVIAPLAPGAPRVTASSPTPMSDAFDDAGDLPPEEPDVGFLKLDEPITLAHYGVLTDVSAKVEDGTTLKAATAVRTAEKPEAPLKAVDGLDLTSTTGMGYKHGFGVELFSHGGDSGAGLFLVENGVTSHKLIAVARQPDPDTNTDMLTRIDAEIIAWFNERSGE